MNTLYDFTGKPLKLSQTKNTAVQVLIDQIKEKRTLWRKEISDWTEAREAYYAEENPITCLLQDVYHDLMLDDQLTTVTEHRKLRILNQPILLYENGKVNEKKTEELNAQPWLFDFMGHCLDSIFYGYSLLYFRINNRKIDSIELLPRTHVSPHNRLLLKEESDPVVGVDWIKFPYELFYAQMYAPQGLLEKAAPLTIIKRHSWASWDEFEQIFGIPIRIAKYSAGNDDAKKEIAGWLKDMGSAAYGVFPKEAEIDIKENKGSDAFKVFLEKIQKVDSGLTKLILHQTMTTDDGSSRSQAEVHQNTLEQLAMADERKMLVLLQRFLEVLAYWDYGFSGKETPAFQKTIDPARQIEIDSKLMSGGIILTQEYIEKTYGVQVAAIPSVNSTSDEGQKKKPFSTSSNAMTALSLHYRTLCNCNGCSKLNQLKHGEDVDFRPVAEKHIRAIFDERAVSPAQRQTFWKQYYHTFKKGLRRGFSPSFVQKNKALAQRITENIGQFSAFKTLSFENALKEALTENGKALSWQEFKKKTASIDDQYNRRWLKTEYDHTVASANMTEKWQKFQEQKHLYPNLRYETVGDAKVRPEHQVWDGVVLPIDHPFWNTRYPPNDWGCRCDVVQTDETPAERPVNQGKVPRNFSHNPARSGQIFKDPAYAQQLSKDQLKTAYALAKNLLGQEAGKDFLPTLRKERKEIKVLAKKRLVGKTVEHAALDKPIRFTMTGIKEALNQPHQHILEKNRAVKNILEILPKAKYLGYKEDYKSNPMVKKIHLFKTLIKQEPSYIVIRELKNGKLVFYTVSDTEKMIVNIKK